MLWATHFNLVWRSGPLSVKQLRRTARLPCSPKSNHKPGCESADPFWPVGVLESSCLPSTEGNSGVGAALVANVYPECPGVCTRGVPGGGGETAGSPRTSKSWHGQFSTKFEVILAHVSAVKPHISIQNMIWDHPYGRKLFEESFFHTPRLRKHRI